MSGSLAASPPSPTPILDRQAPFPPLAARSSNAGLLIGVGTGFLAGITAVLVCAGPAASIVSGCAALLLPSKGLAVWSFGLASVVGGLADLVPFRARSIVSDGARIWMLL
jgi:hypothetical protein